jgi:hypothetical protein
LEISTDMPGRSIAIPRGPAAGRPAAEYLRPA